MNAAFFTIVCLTGTLAWIAWAVPIDAGMAIVLWIGIVITAQAFQATPLKHAPAVVVGLLPGVAAWGALLLKNGLRAAGMGSPGLETLKWLKPVYPGDALSLRHTIVESRPLRKRADVGLVQTVWEMFNQDGEKVLHMEGYGMFQRRTPDPTVAAREN